MKEEGEALEAGMRGRGRARLGKRTPELSLRMNRRLLAVSGGNIAGVNATNLEKNQRIKNVFGTRYLPKCQ